MDNSKELSEIFYTNIGRHFNVSPPGYHCIDLHFIHDFHFYDYLKYIVNTLNNIALIESDKSLYNKIYLYCVDDDRFDFLLPLVERFNLNQKKNGHHKIINLERFTADSQKLALIVSELPDKSACIIFDADKLSNTESHFEKKFNRYDYPEEKQQFLNLLNFVKMVDDKFSAEGYIAVHSMLAPVTEFDEYNVFVNEIDRLSIFEFYRDGEIHQQILRAVNASKNYLNDHNISEAKKAIECCKEIKDPVFVFIQIFTEFSNKNNKMYSLHVHEMLKELDLDSDFSVQSGLNMVNVCVGAESYPAARKILKKIASELFSQNEIERGIQLADASGCKDISCELIKKLEVDYPDSLILHYRDITSALSDEDYARAGLLFSQRDDEHSQKKSSILLQLISWIDGEGGNIITYLNSQDVMDRDTVYFLNHIALKWALRRHDYIAAIDISLLYEQVLDAEDFIRNSRSILDAWLFNRNNPATDEEKIKANIVENSMVDFLTMTFKKLFSNNSDPYLRERFIDTLSWESSHSVGHSMLILITCNQFFRREISFKNTESEKYDTMSLEVAIDRIEQCMVYYQQIGIVVTGINQVPADILTGQRDEQLAFLDKLHTFSVKMATDIEDVSDINTINALISIAHSAAYLARPCCRDLDIIKDVGAVLSRQGYAQAARDLAEQALQRAGDDLQRQRAAWLAAAEIYQRQNNNHPAMVYLNCAMSGNEMTIREFFTYSNLVIRVFRDTGFYSFASEAVEFSRHALKEYDSDLYCKNKKLYDFLALTIRFFTLRNKTVFDAELADNVVQLAKEIALEEVHHTDNLAPVLTLSLQIVDLFKLNHYEIDDEFNALIEEMLTLNDSMGNPDKLLSAFSDFFRESNINNLFTLYRLMSSSTRYADDRAYDDYSLHFYAAVLLRRHPGMSVVESAFTAELLTDSSYSLHDDYLYSNPYPRYESISAPAEYALAYANKNNVAVYMLVLDDDKKGRLLCWLPGKEGEIIDPSLWHFDFSAFKQWKKAFPYEYGFYDAAKNPNLFFDSTEFIRFDFSFNENSIMIFDVMLQSLVPNLIPLQSGLAGTQAAISCAPSLAWLEQSCRAPVKTNGNLVSWISTAGLEGQTLKAMAEEFSQEEGVFTQWNVARNGDSALPVEFENSELVIIGAHGGVTDSEHVFRSISDEGNLRVNFSTFSSRLRQCGVVILFVCSSGRFNNHPESATTIGLAKELLNNGCAAVVASPWPLDPMMTMKWLPLFMERWMVGATVSEAVFAANKTLTDYYSYDYSKCIALSVFGDGSRQYQKR